MKLARRILITIACTIAAIFLVVRFVAPIALSFFAARKALPVARIVPTELQDHSISQARGMQLSYVGYEFEIPWDDLDESKTQLYPKDKPTKTMAVLSFRSGLRLMVMAGPPRSFADQFVKEMKMSPQTFEAVFGHDAATSDYAFAKRVYEFTPDRMHHWTLSSPVFAREEVLLMVKSIMPSNPAETGIFNICNQTYRGFQQGDPRITQDRLQLDLYSGEGGFEITFFQRDHSRYRGVTQPEINRIVQSLRRTAPDDSKSLTAASK